MSIKHVLSSFLLIVLPFISLEAQNPNSISDFLRSSKERYEQVIENSENSGIIHFVMGNESADLDSIISSIAYAYLLNQEASNKNELYIPLLNIHREEIALRKDILYLFQYAGISIDTLLFLDDNVPLNALFAKERLRLDLVDHNILRPRQKHLSDAVERIIDHHVDENIYYPLMSSKDKIIAEVGSNTTLISEKLLANLQIKISPELAVLLLGPILIDTANLKSVEKTTKHDVQVTETLKIIASNELPQDFFNTLLAAKNDISDLTPTMLLSKDFKEYLDEVILYGISSLPPTVQWKIEDLECISSNIQKYAADRNLTYLILLLSSSEPNTKRKIFIYSPSIDLLEAFDSYVQLDEKLKDILIPDIFSKQFQISSYRSEKPIARKQLQPLFHFSANPEIKIQFEHFKK